MEESKKELEKKYNDTIKRYDSLVRAVRELEKYVSQLEARNVSLESQLENAQTQINQLTDNMIRVTTAGNEQQQNMAAEVSILRAKIKRLENGDNNNLGN